MKLTNTKKLLTLGVVLIALASGHPASAFYNPGTGQWLSRDPLGEKAFAVRYLTGRHGQDQEWFLKQATLPSYLFVRNEPILTHDMDGAAIPPPSRSQAPNWRSSWRERYEELRRRPNFCGPKKACETANLEMNASVPCSSLGWKPEPKLYSGCRTDKIRQAGSWLRDTGDEVPADHGSPVFLGADKLAHCYTFCVATYWWYVPGLFYSRADVGEDSDPNDVAANEAGFRLGRGMINREGRNPRSCLTDCARATYNMPFD